MGDTMNASEAVYGFAGWLTSRKERTVMSSTDDAGVIADLVAEFCAVNKLAEPRDGWSRLLVHPSRTTSSDALEKGKETNKP